MVYKGLFWLQIVALIIVLVVGLINGGAVMRFFIFVTLLAISACAATHKAADPEVLIQANRKAALEKIDVLACLDRGA